ncbi:hypothetical protein AB1Y20_009320 [Prymnesium parvum]|uniref:Secreted protein n=1 Tax=Prymnesium parvum TaxID=97485 RepID=A0AB34K6A0_PRYPA
MFVLTLLLHRCEAMAASPRLLEESPHTPNPSGKVSGKAVEGWTLWGTARNFFNSRQKSKAKASGVPLPTPAPSMPRQFGVDFKHVVAWYCQKGENKQKRLCAGTPGEPGKAKPSSGDKVS